MTEKQIFWKIIVPVIKNLKQLKVGLSKYCKEKVHDKYVKFEAFIKSLNCTILQYLERNRPTYGAL